MLSSQSQPGFPARRRPPSQRLGGRCQGRIAPSAARAALTERARLAATLFLRLAGLGCVLLGRPLGGGRARGRPKGAAEAAEQPQPPDGDGAGVGGGHNSGMGAPRSRAEAVPGWSARRATHLTRSAPQQSPRAGDGGREERMGTGRAGAYRLAPGGADGAEQGARAARRCVAAPHGGQADGAARRPRKPVGLKPEHGAYRLRLQRRGSLQGRASTRPLQRQLSGGFRTTPAAHAGSGSRQRRRDHADD
jgi:hypothetical protein